MQKSKRIKFGSLLKEKRVAAGLTQAQVSRTFGWSTPQFISNMERGHSFPPIENLKLMAKLYKIPTQELFDAFEEATIELLKSELHRKFKASEK